MAEVKAAVGLLPTDAAMVIDVGAHVGRWTQELLERAGERIDSVYAFEPSTTSASKLHERLKPYSGTVEIIQAGVSNKSGEAVLFGPCGGSSQASLVQRVTGEQGKEFERLETITTVTLDEFTRDRQITTIHFVKMDIEGLEYSALQGAGELLREGRIRALSFEFSHAVVDSRVRFKDYWDLLSECGYRLFRIVPRGRLLPIASYTPGLECTGKSNYIAAL